MRMRSTHGNAEAFPGKHVRSGRTAADERRATRHHRAIRSLRPAQAKLQHRIALRRMADPRRFGGDERLEVDHIQQRRLEQLTLQNRPANSHERLMRKNDGSFGNRVHIARHTQRAEIVEKAALKQRCAVISRECREIREVVVLKAEVAQKLDRIRKPRSNRVSALERQSAEEQMKHRLLLGTPAFPISGGHRELIKVGEERVQVVHNLRSIVVVGSTPPASPSVPRARWSPSCRS